MIECTWEHVSDFFEANSKIEATSRDPSGAGGDVPGIAFAAFDGSFGEHAIAAEGLWAMAWDFDDVGQVEFERALEAIKAAGFERGLAHTTWSFGEKGIWTPERPVRARVIAPFSEPIPAAYWFEIWHRLASIAAGAGAPPDGQCKNVNRWYYLPVSRVEGAVPDWARPCWFESWGPGKFTMKGFAF